MAAGTVADDKLVEHGILIRGKWQWTINSSTGRWTNPQQGITMERPFVPTDPLDPYNDGFGVRRSRRKLRGKGQALVIRFESEDGKDFQLLGWSIPYTAKDKE